MSARRRRRRSDGPSPIGGDLDALLGHLGAPASGAVRGVFEDWAAIVGERIAAHATPSSLRDGVLLVEVDDPAWASQLTFMEADLVGRLDAALGAGTVRSIRHRVRPDRGGPARR